MHLFASSSKWLDLFFRSVHSACIAQSTGEAVSAHIFQASRFSAPTVLLLINGNTRRAIEGFCTARSSSYAIFAKFGMESDMPPSACYSLVSAN